jgi:hypothetical protein
MSRSNEIHLLDVSYSILTKVDPRVVSSYSETLRYVIPILRLKMPPLFRVSHFIADYCNFDDGDAERLGQMLRSGLKTDKEEELEEETDALLATKSLEEQTAIMRQRMVTDHCYLTHISLKGNLISNAGAVALKKGMKYNPKLLELNLEANPRITDASIIKIIEARCERHRQGLSSLGAWKRLTM